MSAANFNTENTEGTEPAEERKPRLVYYDESDEAWCIAPAALAKAMYAIADWEDWEPGETVGVLFARKDMTDAEVEALPEA